MRFSSPHAGRKQRTQLYFANILAALDAKVIDLMRAHVPANTVESAYNRAAFMDRRIEIAQDWADLLCEGLTEPAELLESNCR